MTSGLEIFVIFHKRLYPEMYSDLEADEYESLWFIAVNEDIPKEYDRTIFPNVINEWDLPIYNPRYQKSNWANGGTNHHIIMNGLGTQEYIGFVQYDMKFPKGSIRKILEILKSERDIGVSIKTMSFSELMGTSTYGFSEYPLYQEALNQLPALKSDRFPLFHVCFMRTELYNENMENLLKIDTHLEEFCNRPGDPWYRFPILTERTLALMCAGLLKNIVEVPEITHERLT